MTTKSLQQTYLESDGLALAELVHKGEVQPIELVETAVTGKSRATGKHQCDQAQGDWTKAFYDESISHVHLSSC